MPHWARNTPSSIWQSLDWPLRISSPSLPHPLFPHSFGLWLFPILTLFFFSFSSLSFFIYYVYYICTLYIIYIYVQYVEENGLLEWENIMNKHCVISISHRISSYTLMHTVSMPYFIYAYSFWALVSLYIMYMYIHICTYMFALVLFVILEAHFSISCTLSTVFAFLLSTVTWTLFAFVPWVPERSTTALTEQDLSYRHDLHFVIMFCCASFHLEEAYLSWWHGLTEK